MRDMKEYLRSYVKEVQNLYGNALVDVILYGSYARGDFTEGSDVDIMVLLNIPRESLPETREKLFNIGYKYYDRDSVEIRAISENDQFFRKLMHLYPFFNNIAREGVSLNDVRFRRGIYAGSD